MITLKIAHDSKELALAFDLFYNETSPLVFRFCKKRNLNQADIDDVIQIIYTQIFNKRTKYNENFSPLAWLFIITKSEIKDYLKKNHIYNRYITEYTDFINMSQNGDHNPSLLENDFRSLDVIKHLTEKEKAILEQRFINEEDFESISKTLGLTEVNIRKMISRTIKKIKKRS